MGKLHIEKIRRRAARIRDDRGSGGGAGDLSAGQIRLESLLTDPLKQSARDISTVHRSPVRYMDDNDSLFAYASVALISPLQPHIPPSRPQRHLFLDSDVPLPHFDFSLARQSDRKHLESHYKSGHKCEHFHLGESFADAAAGTECKGGEVLLEIRIATPTLGLESMRVGICK